MSASTAVMDKIPETTLAKYVRFLVGSFRVGEAEDGEVLARGLTALLGSYPEWVVRAVCDPRSGLPATSKFFPTLFEVRSACDAQMRPVLDAERRRRISAENAAGRPAEVSQDEAERRRAVVAAWRAKQSVQEATVAGVETPMEAMDARKLHGKHKEMVLQALDAKIERISAASKTTPLRLSDMALRSLGMLMDTPAPPPHPPGAPIPESPAWLEEVPPPDEVPMEAAE